MLQLTLLLLLLCPPQTAVVSLGNTKQPLPGFQSHGPQLAQRHGELNSNVKLAASMPEVRSVPGRAAVRCGAIDQQWLGHCGSWTAGIPFVPHMERLLVTCACRYLA